MIFLDNAGTTKMFKECVNTYSFYACEEYYNPSAVTKKSAEISSKINEARTAILKKLGTMEGTIIFTSGATESNNLAIKGSIRGGDYEYVFSNGEHPSVMNVAKNLMQQGKIVHFVKLQKNGQIDLEDLKTKLNKKTKLISVIFVSNETGAINNIKEISRLRDKFSPNALLHVDAVQGFMKIPFKISDLNIDMLTFSAHKFHGPKGVGGLYVRKMNYIKNIVDGGGQEYGLRSGTENVPGIMSLQTAVEMIDIKKNFDNVVNLKEKFNAQISKEKRIRILDFEGSPYIETLIFCDVKGETMLHALEERGVIVGLGSACSSKKAGNRVLEEIGVDKNDIISTCRVSFNAYQTQGEIEEAGKIIVEVYNDIRKRINI